MNWITLACGAGMILLLTACSGVETEHSYPIDPEDARKLRAGRLTGDGITLFDPNEKDEAGGGGSPIGVNAFLWRGALDTVSFMPLATVDPFGGVIITDWYEDPKTPGERFKIHVLILDRTLRSDGVKAQVFKQALVDGQWREAEVPPSMAREIEDTILTRAREMNVQATRR